MLIQFTVGNFRSFNEKVTISMVAAALTSKDKAIDENNVIDDVKPTLLRSAAIYGANASGKSNLISAIWFMRRHILSSAKDGQLSDKIDVDSFRLSTECEAKPSHFELIFLMEGTRYRYGFEADRDRVVAEWLLFVPKSREAKLFERDGDNISLGERFKEGRGITQRVRENALFLSVAAQFNGKLSGKILEWFQDMSINRGIAFDMDQLVAKVLFQETKHKESILELIRNLDFDIQDISSEQVPLRVAAGLEIPEAAYHLFDAFEGQMVFKIRTVHKKYDGDRNVASLVNFDLEDNESHGTQRVFASAPTLVSALAEGRTVWIDELGVRLHPLLTLHIIELFNNRKINRRNAQLIFTIHDTNLLSNKLFRRDQVWFMEKDKWEVSHLYSLAEFKVRNDASFERDYIHGRYGAIPSIGDLQSLFAGG